MLSVAQQYRELRERKVDLIVGRIRQSMKKDIEAEILFHDRMFVVAGSKNRWARRRKVELSQLADEPWSLPPPGTLVGSLVADMFRACGMDFPPRGAVTGSIHLFCALLASGSFSGDVSGLLVAARRKSSAAQGLARDTAGRALAGRDHDLEEPDAQPGNKLFIECAREVVKPLAKDSSECRHEENRMMSPMGHSRHFERRRVMTASPP